MKIAGTSKATRKRKQDRPLKFQPKPSPLENQEEENVCFICFDGGNLVPCNHRDCTKVYHPHCVDRDETVSLSRRRQWHCARHICSNCENAAHFMCYMCTYSLCKGCTIEAGFLCDRANKGLCKPCLGTVSLIEKNKQENNEMAQVQVDFEDKNVWAGFKDYWILLKEKLSLTLDNQTQVGNPWKEYGSLAHKEESSEKEYDSIDNQNFTSPSCSGNHEVSTSEFIKTIGNSKSYEGSEHLAKVVSGEGLSISNKTTWASKELLDFVAYMKNGDTSVLSEFDVKALLLSYIKENNLRDPLRKSQINCDSRLATLFGKTSVMHFEMLKLLESFLLVKQETQSDEIHGENSEADVSQLEADSSDDAWTEKVIKERSKKRKNCVEREQQANLVSHILVETRGLKVSMASPGARRNMFTKGVVSVGDKGNIDTDADESSRNLGRDALESRSEEKSNNRALATGSENGSLNDQVVVISKSSSAPETTLISLLKKAAVSSTISGTQIYHCLEVSNEHTRRPQYSRNLINKLRHFKDLSGYFPANARLWRTGETKDDSTQMFHALNGELLEDSPHRAGNGVYKATGLEQEIVSGPNISTSPVHYMVTGSPTKNGKVTLNTELLSSTKVEVVGYLQEDPSTSLRGLSLKSDMGITGVTSSVGAPHTHPSTIIDNPQELSEDDDLDPLNKYGTNVPVGAEAQMQDKSDIVFANIQDIVPEQPTPSSGGTVMDIDRDSLAHVISASNSVASTVSSSGISPLVHAAAVLSCTTSDTDTSHGKEEGKDKHTLTSQYSTELTDKIWYYQVPSGKIQGPHSMLQLRKWFRLGYFRADMKLWGTTENKDESILMIDAFNLKFAKESPHCLGNGGDPQTISLENTTVSGPNASCSLVDSFVSEGPTTENNMKASNGLVSSMAVGVCENLLPGSQKDVSTLIHDSNPKCDPGTSGVLSTTDPQQSLQSTTIGEPYEVSQGFAVDPPNESAAHSSADAEVDERKSCSIITENIQGIVHGHFVPSSTGTLLNTNTNFVSVNDSPSKGVADSMEEGMNKDTCRMTRKRELTGKIWHYQDQSGNIHGPYSLVQLRKWCSTGYFPANLRLWRKENQDDSILMVDAFSGKLLKEPIDSSANDLVSQAPGLEQATVSGPNASELPADYTLGNSTDDGYVTPLSGSKSDALSSLCDSSPRADPGTSGVLFSVDAQQNLQCTMTDNPQAVTPGDFYYRSNESTTESLAPVGLDGEKGSVIFSTTFQGIVREGPDPLTPACVGAITHTGPNSISATISHSKALALSVVNWDTSVNNHRSEENYHGLQFRLTQKLEIYRTETESNGWGSDQCERINPSGLPSALQRPEAPDHGYRDVGPSSLYKSDESVNATHEAGTHPLPGSSDSVSTPIETKSDTHPSMPDITNWERQIQENQDTGRSSVPEDSNTGWSPWPKHVNENMRWDVSR